MSSRSLLTPSLVTILNWLSLNAILRLSILAVALTLVPLAQAGFDVSASGLPPNQEARIPGHAVDNNGNIQSLDVLVFGVDESGSFYHPGCVFEVLPCDYTLTWIPDGTATVNGTVYQAQSAIIRAQVDPGAPHRCIPECSEATIFVTASGGWNLKPNDVKQGGDACPASFGMARYAAHSMLASLNVEDTPIWYSPPRGPAIPFTVTYNHREIKQPQSFTYSNLGPKWTFNWLSFVTDDPNNLAANAALYRGGGGSEIYTGFASSSGKSTRSARPRDPSPHVDKSHHLCETNARRLAGSFRAVE